MHFRINLLVYQFAKNKNTNSKKKVNERMYCTDASFFFAEINVAELDLSATTHDMTHGFFLFKLDSLVLLN
jgi:hypothetical protein